MALQQKHYFLLYFFFQAKLCINLSAIKFYSAQFIIIIAVKKIFIVQKKMEKKIVFPFENAESSVYNIVFVGCFKVNELVLLLENNK